MTASDVTGGDPDLCWVQGGEGEGGGFSYAAVCAGYEDDFGGEGWGRRHGCADLETG